MKNISSGNGYTLTQYMYNNFESLWKEISLANNHYLLFLFRPIGSIFKLFRLSNVYSFLWNGTFPLVMTSLKRSRTTSEIFEDWDGVAQRGKEITYFIMFKGRFCLKVWLRLSTLWFSFSLIKSFTRTEPSFLLVSLCNRRNSFIAYWRMFSSKNWYIGQS